MAPILAYSGDVFCLRKRKKPSCFFPWPVADLLRLYFLSIESFRVILLMSYYMRFIQTVAHNIMKPLSFSGRNLRGVNFWYCGVSASIWSAIWHVSPHCFMLHRSGWTSEQIFETAWQRYTLVIICQRQNLNQPCTRAHGYNGNAFNS